MGNIVGYHHLSLSVVDLARSAEWYQEVLAMEIEQEIEGAGFRRARLRAPNGDVTLTLTSHDEQFPDLFCERRAGLDHVAFKVGGLEDIKVFKTRFERLGINHSDIKCSGGDAAMITLRDPDNIQLEVFWVRLP